MHFELGQKGLIPFVRFKGYEFNLTGIETIDNIIMHELSGLGGIYLKVGTLENLPLKMVEKTINFHLAMHSQLIPDSWEYHREKGLIVAGWGKGESSSVWSFDCPDECFGESFMAMNAQYQLEGGTRLSTCFLQHLLKNYTLRRLDYYYAYTKKN